MTAALVVFAFTYVLIAAPRLRILPLDRPAGALLGACLVVSFGILTPAKALAAVNAETLLLLFGLMGVGAFLADSGLLDRVSEALLARAKTPARLLGFLVWGAGGLSALVTNDAVCVLGAPIVVAWIERSKLPRLPFLLGLATAANTGSVATLVGNPQNMLCATLGGLSYREYAFHMLPVALMGLALNHALLHLAFRKELHAAALEASPRDEAGTPLLGGEAVLTGLVLCAMVYAFFHGGDLAWTAAAGFTALLVVHRAESRGLWSLIDWPVLLFFAGLFVVVEGLVASGAATWALSHVPVFGAIHGTAADYVRLAAVFLVGSNVVSNVPFILVIRPEMAHLPNQTLAWELLAMASTFAGNLTLLGSVANIIVAERSEKIGGLRFFEYLRTGLPLALATTALGTLWLLWVHGVI